MAPETHPAPADSDLPSSLPLRRFTPAAWATEALGDISALLNDHAHLERKAATNALDLLQRWPHGLSPDEWVRAITSIARDEAQHLALVARILRSRQGSVTKTHEVRYAKDLHGLVRYGEAQRELLDRLLISALIEARSCERFALLGKATTDLQLSRLYQGLWSSERGHFQLFLGLARTALPDLDVDARWDWFLEQEAQIIASQSPGPRIHSWPSCH